MKKQWLFIFFYALWHQNMIAQKVAVGIRTGYGTQLQYAESTGSLIGSSLLFLTDSIVTTRATAQIGANISFSLSEKFALELMGGHQRVTQYKVYFDEPDIKRKIGKIEQFSFLSALNWQWYQQPRYMLYSGAGVGVGFVKGKSLVNDYPARRLITHLNLISISTKGKLQVHVGLGLGAMGTMSAGLKYAF
jgi:hypothetical protein